MSQLIELPGNQGKVFAVDPHRVTGVAPYEGPLSGRTGVYEMSIVWLDNRTLFVCAWPFLQTLDFLNGARGSDAEVFAAGYEAAVEAHVFGEKSLSEGGCAEAWKTYLGEAT